MNEKAKSAALMLLLATLACQQEGGTPPMVPTATPDVDGISETSSAPEVDATYHGKVQQGVSQGVMEQLSKDTGYPIDKVGGYTLSLDRSAVGMGNLEISFGLAPELAIVNGQASLIYRDHMFYPDLQGGQTPLYRKLIDNPNGDGSLWVELGMYTSGGAVIGAEQPVLRYPADTVARYKDGIATTVLFYPTEEMRNSVLLGASSKPIALVYEPKLIGNPIDLQAPTPFSDQEISYNGNSPLAASTPAPETPIPSTQPTVQAVIVPPTETATAIPTEAPVPENTFNICTPENFRDCPITIEDLMGGEYRKWLDTLPNPFAGRDTSKIKVTPYKYHDGDILMYGDELDPDPETWSWVMGPTAAYYVSENREMAVLPVAFYDPKNPNKPLYVITTLGIKGFSDRQVEGYIKTWKSKPLIILQPGYYFNGQVPDGVEDVPAVMSYRLHRDMSGRVKEFGETGIPTRLGEPGVIISAIAASY